MKIDQALGVINSQAVTRIEHQDSSQLRFWQGERPQFELPEQPESSAVPTVSSETAPPLLLSTVLTFDQFDISKQGLQVSYSLNYDASSAASGVPGEVRYEISNEDQVNIMMIENFMRRLTGKKVNLHIPIKIIIQRTPINAGLEIDSAKNKNESASLKFSASDEISLSLDSDGTSDQVSRLVEGNGFLALELNTDNNSGIDAADQIYDRLRIWEQRNDGSSTMLALGESGIGAVYLGHMAGVFDLKNDANSGIYQLESGTSSMHQLDMVL